MLLRVTSLRRLGVQQRRLASDMTPMTIADRIMAEAAKKGSFKNLEGEGKPLTHHENSQAHVATLPKNMAAR